MAERKQETGIPFDFIRETEREVHVISWQLPLKSLTHIAIDEIAMQNGRKYLTAAMDLKSGRVIFVGDGKDASLIVLEIKMEGVR